jgi:hypothetical protein
MSALGNYSNFKRNQTPILGSSLKKADWSTNVTTRNIQRANVNTTALTGVSAALNMSASSNTTVVRKKLNFEAEPI